MQNTNDTKRRSLKDDKDKMEGVSSTKSIKRESCRDLEWEMLWAVTAGVRPCTLLSVYCSGIASEKSRCEENQPNTSPQGLFHYLLKQRRYVGQKCLRHVLNHTKETDRDHIVLVEGRSPRSCWQICQNNTRLKLKQYRFDSDQPYVKYSVGCIRRVYKSLTLNLP